MNKNKKVTKPFASPYPMVGLLVVSTSLTPDFFIRTVLPCNMAKRTELLVWGGKIGNCLMEVRASSACARLLWESLDRASDARQMLRQIFDKFDTLCSLPNFFTPLRLTGLTAAMVRGRKVGEVKFEILYLYGGLRGGWRERGHCPHLAGNAGNHGEIKRHRPV